jgi:dihydroxycyclohexadiene carboxylate dehydrogenase
MTDTLDPSACGARRFQGKVAVVTGAAQGIGRATARRLAQEGAAVAVTDLAAGPAEFVVDELRAHGASAIAVAVDLRCYRDAARLFDTVVAALERVDVLVNNVGGTIHVRPFSTYDIEQIRAEVDRSLWPTLWCCRAVLPIMEAQRSGAIVNVGSLAPRGIYRVPYAASKGGVAAITTSLALETARSGIRVNCVVPGPTEITDRMTPRRPTSTAPDPLQAQWDAELAKALETETPMGRSAHPREQASAVAFLASDDASFITGQILCVAGGGTL